MTPLPYKIAALCYVFDSQNRLLLLHRFRPPNRDLYSPIGGKLEQAIGESPYACALREIHEEIGVQLTLDDIRLAGIVSERGFEGGNGQQHWLMFCFEVTRPLDFPARQIDEGRLEWFALDQIAQLDIPKTDREVIWPLVQRHSVRLHPHQPDPGFFSVHIDCTHVDHFAVTVEHPKTTTPSV
jgi:8-oxo-dGTP diphosphatase